jgi:hypothetical protein
VFVLLLAGGARCEERGEGTALNKELQPLQGLWAAVPRGWLANGALDQQEQCHACLCQ